eukprot:750845-Prorocentrum_lima.AAC.1
MRRTGHQGMLLQHIVGGQGPVEGFCQAIDWQGLLVVPGRAAGHPFPGAHRLCGGEWLQSA